MKVVLADANEMVRDGLRLVIKQALPAVEIIEAQTVSLLIKAVMTECPTIVILDWALLGSKPGEAGEKLRFYCPNTALAALSVRPEDQQEAQLADVDRVFSKAEPPDALIEYLKALFHRTG